MNQPSNRRQLKLIRGGKDSDATMVISKDWLDENGFDRRPSRGPQLRDHNIGLRAMQRVVAPAAIGLLIVGGVVEGVRLLSERGTEAQLKDRRATVTRIIDKVKTEPEDYLQVQATDESGVDELVAEAHPSDVTADDKAARELLTNEFTAEATVMNQHGAGAGTLSPDVYIGERFIVDASAMAANAQIEATSVSQETIQQLSK